MKRVYLNQTDICLGDLFVKNIILSTVVVTTFSLFSVTEGFADTAFGITLGQQLPDGAKSSNDDGWYDISPTKKHSLFNDYQLAFHGDSGVCSIIANSKNYENDKYGSLAQMQYDRIKASLNKKYISNKGFKDVDSIEYLRDGALWKEDDEFARSIVAGDRDHYTAWNFEGNALELIILAIGAEGSDETYLQLNYFSSKFEECLEKLSSSDSDAL